HHALRMVSGGAGPRGPGGDQHPVPERAARRAGARGAGEQHGAGRKLGQRRLARAAAALEMLLETEPVVLVEAPQRPPGAQIEILVAMCAHTHASCGSSSRNRTSPCRVHDFTVPSGAPMRRAISLCDSPWK